MSENAIRPFAVGRKNWLFSDSVAGANASAVVYTIVEMAKAHDLNIYGYLKFLLEHRPTKEMTDEQLAELAPWSEKLQSIKNRMWIIVNYSNSQRAGVILQLTVLLFGGYDRNYLLELMEPLNEIQLKCLEEIIKNYLVACGYTEPNK